MAEENLSNIFGCAGVAATAVAVGLLTDGRWALLFIGVALIVMAVVVGLRDGS